MRQLELHVSPDRGWTEVDGRYVWGNVFRDDELFEGRRLADLFGGSLTWERFRSIVSTLNGKFAVVAPTESRVFAAVDRWQSRPLFYSHDAETVAISDDPGWLRDARDDHAIDEVSAAEYRRSTFVSGEHTLAPSLKQLQTAELLAARDGDGGPRVETDRYYRFADRETRDWNESTVLERYDAVLDRVFGRLADFADGRPIAISLSCGHDSRLLAVKLRELDYPDLYAFSYARSGEDRVAREIADSLDIEFEQVPLSHEEIAEWYDSDDRRQFDSASGIEDSVPIYWLTVVIQKLRRETAIPPDAVIVTGDGAHTMASHLPQEFAIADSVTRTEFVDAILDVNHVPLRVESRVEDAIRRRILDALPSGLFESKTTEPASEVVPAFEEWDWQERQAKVIRSNFVYEYCGYDCWFPLKDNEYMDFWRTVPLRHREDKAFHRTYVERKYGELTGMDSVKSTFEPMPDWLWYVNRTVGELPVVGPVGRSLYYRLFEDSADYKPMYGMLDEREFERTLDELPLDDEEVHSLTPRHLHAQHLLDEYNPPRRELTLSE